MVALDFQAVLVAVQAVIKAVEQVLPTKVMQVEMVHHKEDLAVVALEL
jgi:hypothetical protein